MPKKKPGRTTRKPGGQPGNKNAERHGFYSKQFTKDESQRLDGIDLHNLDDEIKLINVFMGRLSKLLKTVELKDEHLKALNTLSLMMQSKSTLIRTHYLTRGKGGAIMTTIEEALEEIRLELGI